MQYYSATILYTMKWPHCLLRHLNSIRVQICKQNMYKMLFCINVEFKRLNLQTYFSQDLLFIGCNIFPQVMVICLHLIKHVLLDFNIYQWHFYFGLTTLVAQPVSTLRAHLWKVIMKCKIVIILTFASFF